MPQASRATLKQKSARGSYRREDIYPVLDAAFLCHVGFVIEGEARVLPTAFVRIEDGIYLHGHLRNSMLNALLGGQVATVCVTHLDGLVLARSGFHHSANYRSVTVFGRASEVDKAEKNAVLDALIDHMVPGRAATIRPSSEEELNATLVVKIDIEEAALKTRAGPPVDLAADYELDIWAGVVNLKTVVAGDIEPCSRLSPGTTVPDHIKALAERYA